GVFCGEACAQASCSIAGCECIAGLCYKN
uniref:Cyclotide vodo I1 n=1 Tax=Viola odorata TaxID=97441 RepID=CYV1_VIOOD|nr:RecName: Full=Cyclotide vodo I1 [Viola odorata]